MQIVVPHRYNRTRAHLAVVLGYLLVYFGALVGLAGPFGMMVTHDLRGWAQRQKRCHACFGHKSSFLKDGFRQLHCDIILDHPPAFSPEDAVARDRFYHFNDDAGGQRAIVY